MKATILYFFLFSSLFVNGQRQQFSKYVVRFNHHFLKEEIINDLSIKSMRLREVINEEGMVTITLLKEKLDIDFSELNITKMFPNFATTDTISMGRQGQLVEVPPFWATFVVSLPNSEKTYHLQKLKNAYPLVLYVDPPLKMELDVIPNDSLFGFQTSLFSSTNAGISADSAWNIETGERFIKVGVFDTGVDSMHPDLEVLGGYGYYYDIELDSSGTSIIHEYGIDKYGHGTAVAGVIGAKTDNTIGIAGIAGGDNSSDTNGVSIINFNIGLTDFGDWSADWISMAVIDAARMPLTYYNWGISNPLFNNPPTSEVYWEEAPGYGVYIGNHSYHLTAEDDIEGEPNLNTLPGDSSIFDPPPLPTPECHLCKEAYLFSLKNGVVSVASRGNNFDPLNLEEPFGTIPQKYHDSWLISVGASGTDGKRADYQTGNTATSEIFNSPIKQNVDVIAPGTKQLVATTRTSFKYNNDTLGKYQLFNGTSASAPHVTGVAALLLSHYNTPYCYTNQNLSPADVEYIIEHSATGLGTIPNDSVGWGRLNAYKALQMIDYPNFQIVHPLSPPISEQLVSVDSALVWLDSPIYLESTGPLANTFPPPLNQYYLIERHKYQLTYNFGQYIQPSTDLLDVWVRPSQTNSRILTEDTSTVMIGNPIPYPQLNVDEFQIEPMAYIDTIINDSIVAMHGYYYHFVRMYDDTINFSSAIPCNYWYPFNPSSSNPKQMAYSIYIYDTAAPLYSFDCDSSNILLDSLAEINEIQLDFGVYPNPTKYELTVKMSDKSEIDKLFISNMMGKRLIQQNCTENQLIYTFNVSDWENGIYFVHFVGRDGMTHSKKWIKL